MADRDELDERVRSLTAERYRPTPRRGALSGDVQEANARLIEMATEAQAYDEAHPEERRRL